MGEVEAEKWEGRVVLRLHEGGLQSQWLLQVQNARQSSRPAQEEISDKFPDRTRYIPPNTCH